MFKNYLIVAFRNLARQKVLALINIMGLCIGLASFSLFILYAVNEFSFDRFHANAHNIYRMYEWYEGFPGREPGGEASGYTPLGPALKQDFPDVENFVRVQRGWEDKFVRVKNNVFRTKLSFADPQIFSIFSFKLLSGDKAALSNPRNVVLTKEKALQLFGKTNVAGQRIDIKTEDKFEPFTVGAVTEDIPTNSSIQFSILGSYDYLLTIPYARESITNWHMTIGSETYITLRHKSNLINEPKRLAAFRKKYYADEEAQLRKDGVWNGKGFFPVSFRLQPLTNIHTNPKIGGMAATTDPKNIWILISIAAGVLLIACINFTTLAIGRSAGRAKEVGVRKVMGSARIQLVFQFLIESVMLSIFSGVLAFALANVLLPYFNQLAGTKLSFSFSHFPELSWLLISLTLLTGLLAGTYPALVLAGFEPVEVLKSKIRLGGSNLFTRSLVTVQFVLSIGLIVSTIIIVQQLKFMRSKNLGFNKENVVVIDAEGTDAAKIYPLFRQALQARSGIIGVTGSEIGMGEGNGHMGAGFDYKGETKGVIMYPVDADYLKVMGMQLIAGRNFSARIASDSINSIIVNEALLKDFDLTLSNALGQQLMQKRFEGKNSPRTIIGVVKNFNFSALNENIRPQMFLQPSTLNARKFLVRIKPGDPSKALSALNKVWKSIVPDLPFQYSFLDEDFDRFYKSEERLSNIVGSAGGISIFLACLGLFGLAALAAANRTKEIGIRKVLGAPVSAIVGLLSKIFLKLIIAAIVIATPLAWYFMNKWLQDFAYRIDIKWWVFPLVGIVAILIALITISFQAIKAAIANPVKSLRTE